jgi:hypothetical protein
MVNLAIFENEWIRNPEDWKIPSYNIKKQFSSLLRHLLCKYDVPAFMDKV